MKKIVLGVVLCAFSISSFAAELMTKNEFKKVHDQYTKVGSVTTAGETSAADAKTELSKMADDKGGDIYVLTSGNTNKKVHATADVYKKK
ncbi:DUF1471 family periplasmic protein YahO [Erwinia billingiae]|jgi:hypothetical protein|uniref:Conserved uncharacterized protein n=1 Tax=Erwinia billingiae (strain Eb661) TaxID=634500 RepID=D8MUT5_ERWBE|nr:MULTISPECIES: DUF1471 family periplasmic protein YahO [Erwinia]QBR52560.1 DUF1471 domain-containing protein [Erwinia sp. QL-Z3]CAX60592.1 Conserved uncharacterized protein [Erwinia billingiae Eb661]